MNNNRVKWEPFFAALFGIAFVLFVLSAVTGEREGPEPSAERLADVEARIAKIETRLQEGAYRMGELDADGRELLHLLSELEERVGKIEEGQK